MEDELSKIKNLISKALDELYEKDIYLIDNRPIDLSGSDNRHHVGERTIVFRFAYYMQGLLDLDEDYKNFNLDCEYNRNGIKEKKLPSFPNGTYPDIILHKRGRNDSNLLVIEVKTYWNKNQSADFLKMREFTDELGTYRFRLGAAILIAKKRNKVKIDWFPRV